MALRDWSARRIGFLWLAGVVFYCGLLLLQEGNRRQREARWRAEFGPIPDFNAADTIPAARRDSLASLMFVLLRETRRGPQSHRDSVLQHVSAVARDTPLTAARIDSLYRSLNVPARLSVAQRDSLR